MVNTAKLSAIEVRQMLNLGKSACEAAIAYDRAIRACANDPDKMASFCTLQGETLDTLYLDWREKAKYYLQVFDNLVEKGRGNKK